MSTMSETDHPADPLLEHQALSQLHSVDNTQITTFSDHGHTSATFVGYVEDIVMKAKGT